MRMKALKLLEAKGISCNLLLLIALILHIVSTRRDF